MNRFEITKKVGILGILGNIFLLVIKAVIGIISKSQAMIADAANSAGDIFASIMTWIGNKIASEPSDKDHNFGHGKAEYIFSLLISVSMLIVSIKILYDSVFSIIYKNKIEFSWWLLIVCIITIITKISLYLYAKRSLKKCNNILIISNMNDHRNDCIVTSFTTLSILLSLVNVFWVDGVVGIGISIWIFYTGIKIFMESYNVLMDKSIDEETQSKIFECINKYAEVKGIKSMYTIPTGYKYVVVLTILLDGTLDTFNSHKIANRIQKRIENKFEEIDKVIVHVDPFKESKEKERNV